MTLSTDMKYFHFTPTLYGYFDFFKLYIRTPRNVIKETGKLFIIFINTIL